MNVTKSANAVEMIQAIEQADSPARLVAAVRALAAAQLEEGISTLIKVLGYNNPEAAVAAVEGLVQLGEVAVPAILEQLDDYNYGARAYSFRALAAISDPRALDTLLAGAESDFAPSVRRAAAKGLGTLHWFKLPPNERQPAQERALNTLVQISHDPDWAIRYAATVGLQSLAMSSQHEPDTSSASLVHLILDRLQQMQQTEPDLVVQARVLTAQQQLKTLALSTS